MDFIPDSDSALSTEDKMRLLEQARQRIFDSYNDESVELSVLSDHDAALLRQYAADNEPAVRSAAVDILGEFGPVTWEDAERWMLDEDENVRRDAFFRMDLSYNGLAELCVSDRVRCAELIAKSARLYGSVGFGTSLGLMCKEDPEWVDPLWQQLGPLLDLGNAELNSNIICGILEDFLVDGLITLDDPRLQAWIKGDSIEGKMALLSVVQWFGMREPWQRRITEALADDQSNVVSSTARSFLAGKPVPDIQNRCWDELQSDC